MKKQLGIVVLLITSTIIMNAQNDSTKFIQKIYGGMIVGTVASNTFSGNNPPFSMSYGLLANVTIITPKTYHNLMYGFVNNSARLLNGYFLPKNWDAYLLYSKVLNANQNYLALGIEKMIKADNVNLFLFSELGTDLKGTKILSFGVLISAQNILWKRM
jgi:hypothetical protein